MAVTKRVSLAISRQYGADAEAVVSLIEEAENGLRVATPDERLEAGVLILAEGNMGKLLDAIRLLQTDWRDLLVLSGLAVFDWQDKLDDYFNP